jgi:sugar lactone lactonase YvrE
MKKLFILMSALIFIHCEKSEIYPYPDLLPLPNGFQPEGIVIGPSYSFYVSSLSSGDIYKGDLRTGEGSLFITPATPTPSGGLALDIRSKYLYVAGGFTGTAYIYDYETSTLVQTIVLASPDIPGPSLINDVIVTDNAVYFTDSFRPVIYKVALNISSGMLLSTNQVIPIPLSDGYSMEPHPGNPFPLGAFANGIDATADGKTLILANTDRGELYNVNPNTGETIRIQLGEALVFYADGILLDQNMLYVAQNMMNQIAVIRLNDDLKSGNIVKTIDVKTYPDLGIPTTLDDLGNDLYVVNSHFDIAPPTELHPEVQFEVMKVAK